MGILLFISVLLIAACGLIYELVAGTLASYLLGDSILQFSTVIGTYLFAMGIGSALSRYLNRGLVYRFIWIELLLGVIGGFSSALLMLAFAFTQGFSIILYALVIVMGVLVGLEIPLLMRIVKDRYNFRDVIAHVLTFDYLGALAASLIFPIILVPRLGLVRSAMLFGLINVAVALWTTFIFANQLATTRALRAACLLVLIGLGVGIAEAKKITATAEDNIYADEIIFARDTRYQHLVLTRFKDDIRLFLNSHLQFSSRDEYRYHEALIHPGLASIPAPRRVLVLGGGDGLAVREILKYPANRKHHPRRSRPRDDKNFLQPRNAHRAEQKFSARLPNSTSSTPTPSPGSIRTPTVSISSSSISPTPPTIPSASSTPPPSTAPSPAISALKA